MASYTQHFQLQILDAGDGFDTNGYQFTDADRATIDRLLYVGAISHTHSGAGAVDQTPQYSVSLALGTTTGYLPAGTQCFYGYTLVDPSGFETGLSPAASITTPSPTSPPNPPQLAADSNGGTLPVGGYFYVLSCYTGSDNTAETVTSTAAYVTVPATGEVTVTFPSIPAGANGFNIYRMGPGDSAYHYLTSVAVDVPTPPTTFLDDGTTAINGSRTAPTVDTTSATNNITVTIPTAPPANWTWNLYRTFTQGDWTDSFLANVTTIVNGALTLTFQDLGLSSVGGTPPPSTQAIPSPSQIDLGTDVTGTLPLTSLAAFPMVVTFSFPGSLQVQNGKTAWTNEFVGCTIQSVRATLGPGSAPAAQPVEVDVVTGTGSNPTYTSIFTGGTLPNVPVGAQVGTATTPPAAVALAQGDTVCVNLTQVGGGTTPTDHDLTVNVYMLVNPSGAVTTAGS